MDRARAELDGRTGETDSEMEPNEELEEEQPPQRPEDNMNF
jgi:hypothetical protein